MTVSDMTALIKELRHIVGEPNVLADPEDCQCYGFDASRLKGCPECVVFPANTQEVAAIIRLANRNRTPVFPRGAGSGMVGGAIANRRGLALVLTRMNQIFEIDADNMLAVVQPGVVTAMLQERARQLGLFYPPDPASLKFSTLGGNVAMGAGGPRALKYGVTRDYVLSLQVVLPTGSQIRTGTRTAKGVVGYDLTRLMVGSEGTLGIFTELVLRLIPAPQCTRTLSVLFADLDEACRAVNAILKQRVVPSTIELMDRETLRVVDRYLQLGLPAEAEAMLLIEVDGRPSEVDQDLRTIEQTCNRSTPMELRIAHTEAERELLWRARRSVSPALGKISSGKINEDVTVPRSEIAALIQFTRTLARKHHLTIVCFGHAGDGNIHTNIMLDRDNQDELTRAEHAVEELFCRVLELGGTISGEHGIGIAKSPFLEWELGSEGVAAMWRIKQALDPLDILNPGKMFQPDRAFFRP
jgi:glycolate oxidase